MAEQAKYYATGHRKNAKAKIWLTPGAGNVTINDKAAAAYLGRKTLQILIMQPLDIVEAVAKFDVRAIVLGGGIAGQAGAIRHGISKALVIADPEYRPRLRKLGFLTRDPRVKERKKYGRKRARRGFQFSKR